MVGRLRSVAWAMALSLAGALAVRAQEPLSRRFPIGIDSFASRFSGGIEGAEVLIFQRTADGYRYTERIAIPRLMRRDVTVDFDFSLHVRRVQSSGTIGDRPIQSSVVYDGRRARGLARPLEAQSSAAVRIDTILPARAFDGLALYPVLLSRHWHVGDVDTLVVFDTDEISVTHQVAHASTREALTLPTGTVPALRVELSTTQLPVTLWISESSPHRLLKIASTNGETIRVSARVPSNDR
jgi:hypothetical protein